MPIQCHMYVVNVSHWIPLKPSAEATTWKHEDFAAKALNVFIYFMFIFTSQM